MKCIKNTDFCINRDGLDYRLEINKCCMDEIREDQEIIQNVVDTLEDYKNSCTNSLKKIASKLSYAIHLINHNNEEDLLELFPLLKRYAMLIFEFKEKISNDETISNLVQSFNIELQKWFESRFLNNSVTVHNQIPIQSLVADMQTVEMSLGVCMIEYDSDDSLDDLFF